MVCFLTRGRSITKLSYKWRGLLGRRPLFSTPTAAHKHALLPRLRTQLGKNHVSVSPFFAVHLLPPQPQDKQGDSLEPPQASMFLDPQCSPPPPAVFCSHSNGYRQTRPPSAHSSSLLLPRKSGLVIPSCSAQHADSSLCSGGRRGQRIPSVQQLSEDKHCVPAASQSAFCWTIHQPFISLTTQSLAQ